VNSLRAGLAATYRAPGAFRNWPAVLTSVVSSLATGKPRTLTVRTRSGSRLLCPNAPAARVALWEIFADDCYRLEWFLDSQQPVLRMLDIGAHVGSFALRVAELRRGATLECFEPSPTTYAYLQANIALNNLRDRVRTHQQAVSATEGVLILADDGRAACDNSAAHLLTSRSSKVRVPVVRLMDVLMTADPPFDFVKIDCEGSEYDAVLSTSLEAWRSVTRVVIEYHSASDKGWADLAEFFAAAGFTEVAHQSCEHLDRQGVVWLVRLSDPAVVEREDSSFGGQVMQRASRESVLPGAAAP
jgi:FkbM family methyltransferase